MRSRKVTSGRIILISRNDLCDCSLALEELSTTSSYQTHKLSIQLFLVFHQETHIGEVAFYSYTFLVLTSLSSNPICFFALDHISFPLELIVSPPLFSYCLAPVSTVYLQYLSLLHCLYELSHFQFSTLVSVHESALSLKSEIN